MGLWFCNRTLGFDVKRVVVSVDWRDGGSEEGGSEEAGGRHPQPGSEGDQGPAGDRGQPARECLLKLGPPGPCPVQDQV